MRLFSALLIGACILAMQPAHAQRPADEIDADIAATINSQPLESFIAQFLQPIRQGADGRALTAAEVEAAERRQIVERRAAIIGEMLRYDLDGDGAVTAAEVREGGDRRNRPRRNSAEVQEQLRNQATQKFQSYAKADADRDGRVTVAEMLARDDVQPPRGERRQATARLLLELDADADGKVTAQEAETRARAVFSRYDRDGDGLIDDDAVKALNEQANARRLARQMEDSAARCAMPKPSANDLVVLFQASAGQAVSTVALGSRNETTHAATLKVEPGDKPIYLVLGAGRNMVWQIGGATERVSRLVLLGREPVAGLGGRAGATGIETSKIAFADMSACLGRQAGADGGEQAGTMFTRVLGRSFDISGSSREGVLGIAIPSLATEGQNMRDMRQADPACWTAMRSVRIQGGGSAPLGKGCNWLEAEQKFLYPGGVITIDPARVVSQNSVEPYDVMPSPFGYLSAIGDGTLRDVSGGAMTRFRVMKPMIRFPASELGARPLSFRLTEGVGLPDGAARTTCVLDAKGELVSGRPGRCEMQ